MTLDGALLKRLLQVEPPWNIKDVRLDEARKRLDVSVGVEEPRSWFGLARKQTDAGNEHVWRHLNFGPYQCYVRVHLPAGTQTLMQPWAGEAGGHFTHALIKSVVGWMGEGCDLKWIGVVLDIPPLDVWKFKFAMDTGRMDVEQRSTSAPAAAQVEANTGGSSELPDVTDPIWQELAEGRCNIDIRVLSLKLMLTRVKSQMDVIHDNEVKLLKIRELHRYFARNERVLGHEIAQLRRNH
jgi:hypothetical protein